MYRKTERERKRDSHGHEFTKNTLIAYLEILYPQMSTYPLQANFSFQKWSCAL